MRNETKVINGTEVLPLFMNVEKGITTNLKYLVEQVMNKEKKNDGTKELNPYYKKVKKLVSINVLLSNYKKRVIVEGEKEGLDMTNFESEKPKGKHHISYCVLENDTDPNVKYLGFEPVDNFSKPQIEYYFEGTTIEKHLFDDWVSKTKYESNTQPQEKEVMWRTLDLSNLKEFTLNSTRYIVQD
jgi:hypothetical protein